MRKDAAPFIRVEDLTIGYNGGTVIKNASFTINYSDIFVIMGMSGCGKSTIMRSIIGLLKPRSGRILIDGVDLWAAPQNIRADIIKSFGISYQSGALFSSMTLAENIALPMELGTDMKPADIKDAVNKKLKLVGLLGYENFYPSEVSGGMIKRAALARAMALNPRALFFDEPSAGLDPIRSAELDELIQKINHETQTTVVMVTHELPTIMNIANNSIYITNGRVAASGTPKKILQNTKHLEILEFLTRGQRRIKNDSTK
ncbi:MAG: ATP-binding cassette domain-containing protein [Alphaproteobacteria bacterium]|nr:ATP-binding cassette domain-containing protein [Alphaproteobacteria bacterium]